MNRTQSKNHKMRTGEIKKVSLICFDGKIDLLENGIYTLALRYQNQLSVAEYEPKLTLTTNQHSFLSS